MGSHYLHCSINIFNYIRDTNLLFTVMKATKKEINMAVDIELQKRIIKYIVWGLPQFTFWMIMLTNFLFYVIRGS